MSDILDQQFEDHFGDDWYNVRKRARNYIATSMRRGWLSVSARNKAQTAEGGRNGLLRRCLAFCVEADTIDQGLSDFGAYIWHEYGDRGSAPLNNQGERLQPYSEGYSPTLGEYYVSQRDSLLDHSESSLGESSLAGLSRQKPGIDEFFENFLKSPEEWELFETLASIGSNSIKEAIELLGWDHEDGMRIWWRVYQRRRTYQRKATVSV